jgi:GNAT superfamily N-acetyltransferase
MGPLESDGGEDMSGIETRKAETRRDLKTFITFPWKIYRGDPNWVPPLIADMKEKLDRKRHPFFEHAEAEYFLARRGPDVTGRIAAVLDRAHNSFHGEKTAFFGLFESSNDLETARALLDAATAWGLERGMNILRGPVNLSMNDECAFLLEGFDSPPAVMMPFNPPYYLDLMEQCGLVKAKDLFAFRMNRDHETAAKVREITAKIGAELPVTMRRADPSRATEEARKISLVYNASWEKNWGFVPWTQAEMDHMVRKFIRFADMDLVIFAEVDGRPAGFTFALPNYNEVLIKMNGRLFPFGFLTFLLGRRKIKGIRAMVFGIIPEYRNTGLSYLLYSELEKSALAKGYEWGELSWQLEDNEAINRFAASIGAGISKKYRMFEKSIASRGA